MVTKYPNQTVYCNGRHYAYRTSFPGCTLDFMGRDHDRGPLSFWEFFELSTIHRRRRYSNDEWKICDKYKIHSSIRRRITNKLVMNNNRIIRKTKVRKKWRDKLKGEERKLLDWIERRNIVTICVIVGVPVIALAIVPDYVSHYTVMKEIDFCRFYLAKVASYIDFMGSWGWILWGLPIPIVLPTTQFNTIFCVKLYGSIAMFVASFYEKRGPILVGVVLILAAAGSLEYERRTLSDFETREELITFLHNDRTDSMEYTGGFNCEDFSRTLIQGAKSRGYIIYYHTIPNHALCEAYIVSENVWVQIEPQTDQIMMWKR